ncbi:MAG: CvpA family protein [Bacteroidales bacterium]|nr:CvpA family protein [Bacteroidales bacterium]
MNVLDIILAIPLCYFIYKGWKRGLIFELAALAGIIVGCWAAIHFSTWVAELLHLEGEGSVLIAFFITFIGVVVGSYFLGKAIEGIIKMVKANALNKILGALVGMAKCLCVLSVLLNFILLIDYNHIIITPKVQQESKLYKPTYVLGNKLTSTLKTYLTELRTQHEESQPPTPC